MEEETGFIQLYDSNNEFLEYHEYLKKDAKTPRRHCFLILNSHGGEKAQIWISDKQLKQLFFVLAKSLTRYIF